MEWVYISRVRSVESTYDDVCLVGAERANL